MKIRQCLFGAAMAVGLGLAAASAQAAPAVGSAGDLALAVRDSSNLDQVYWSRRCWRHRGHLHCRRTWVDYGYAPYYDEPYYHRPALGFFFGGHRHHRHHHHHHHHRRHR